jgi:hypothetical protein
VGQKRGYPVARNLSTRATFSDADAEQIVDAATLFTNAEGDVMELVSHHSFAVSSNTLSDTHIRKARRRVDCKSAPTGPDARQPRQVPAGEQGAPHCAGCAGDGV